MYKKRELIASPSKPLLGGDSCTLPSERSLGFAAAGPNSTERALEHSTFAPIAAELLTNRISNPRRPIRELSSTMLLNGSSHHIAAAPVDYHSTFRLRAFEDKAVYNRPLARRRHASVFPL